MTIEEPEVALEMIGERAVVEQAARPPPEGHAEKVENGTAKPVVACGGKHRDVLSALISEGSMWRRGLGFQSNVEYHA